MWAVGTTMCCWSRPRKPSSLVGDQRADMRCGWRDKEKAFPAARCLGNLPNLWSFLDSTLLCSLGGMGPGFTI